MKGKLSAKFVIAIIWGISSYPLVLSLVFTRCGKFNCSNFAEFISTLSPNDFLYLGVVTLPGTISYSLMLFLRIGEGFYLPLILSPLVAYLILSGALRFLTHLRKK